MDAPSALLPATPFSEDDAYRGLFERIPVGIYRTSPCGRMLDANPALVRLAGYSSKEELLATPLHRHWARPGDRVEWMQRMERDGAVRDFEFMHRRRDGSFFWVRETARALRDETGRVVCYEGVVEDVTERKAEKERLRVQAEMLAAVGEAVICNDVQGRINYWNRAAEEMLGYTADEVLGKHILDVPVPPGKHEEAAAILACVLSGRGWCGEFNARRKDGELVPIVLNVEPLLDAAGEVMAAVGIATDIARQKRDVAVQSFLAEAGSILASSLDYDATLGGVARLAVPTLADWCTVDVVEEEGGCVRQVATVHVDPAMEAMTREELHCTPDGRNVTSILLRTRQTWWEADITDELLVRLCEDEEHLRIFRALNLQSAIAVPLVARGRALGVVRFATARPGRRYGPEDVRLAEEVARRAAVAVDNARLYAEARSAVQARERILHVVSHDLRNPLGAVLSHADLLGDDEVPAEVRREYAGVMHGAAEQMNRMIGDLLDITHLEAGQLSIEPAPLSPRALLLEAAAMLRPAANERGVHLSVEGGEGLPPVRADRERLLQVLANLLANALRLTPRGGSVALRAACAGGAVRFAVADTGPGIPQDERDRLFEPFWRGRRAARGGLGLGLSIARGIVEAHGGRIWAESREGEGSTFTFELPVPVAAPVAAAVTVAA